MFGWDPNACNCKANEWFQMEWISCLPTKPSVACEQYIAVQNTVDCTKIPEHKSGLNREGRRISRTLCLLPPRRSADLADKTIFCPFWVKMTVFYEGVFLFFGCASF